MREIRMNKREIEANVKLQARLNKLTPKSGGVVYLTGTPEWNASVRKNPYSLAILAARDAKLYEAVKDAIKDDPALLASFDERVSKYKERIANEELVEALR
jgi:hypothetical protein